MSGGSVWSGSVDTDNADAKIFDIMPDEEASVQALY
jgi:hypothetical protein